MFLSTDENPVLKWHTQNRQSLTVLMKKIALVVAGMISPRHEKGTQDPHKKAPALFTFAMHYHPSPQSSFAHIDAAFYFVKQKQSHCTVGNVKCNREPEAS